MMYQLVHLNKLHEFVQQLVKFDMLRVYHYQDPDLPRILQLAMIFQVYTGLNKEMLL